MGRKKANKKVAIEPQSQADNKKVADPSKSKHQNELDKLKEKDPKFYAALNKEAPGMLNFDSINDDDILSSDDEAGDGIHKIPDRLEVASDDEDFDLSDSEDEEGEGKKKPEKSKRAQIVVDQKMINNWQKQVDGEKPSMVAVREIMQALHGCLARIDADAGPQEGKKKKNRKARQKEASHKYRITTDTVFNSLISLCMQSIPQALDKVLDFDFKNGKLNKNRKLTLPTSCKRWTNIVDVLRVYLDDVLTLTLALVEPQVTRVFIRHMIVMLPYYLGLPKVCKKLAGLLIKLWSTNDEERIRILAFACLYRLLKWDKKRMHTNVLKHCYLSYVANCKFTSPRLLPMINFMQATFAEICAMDADATYRFAFLYIRQLAVHLRKAIVEKNMETRKAVYNWQFVHCVSLWCRVLSVLHPNPTLQPLTYPLIQVAVGMIELVPTQRFYPLRFRVVRNLIGLADCTDTYIPLLPFITAPLLLDDFHKKQPGASLKPLSFDCVLKLSNSQIKDKQYCETTMDQVYDLLVKFFNSQASCISFPEMAVPTLVLLKKFAKECKCEQWAKLIRQVVKRVEENSEFVCKRRTRATFAVTDVQAVEQWQRDAATEAPFASFYKQYSKKRARELTQQIADKDRSVDEKLPTIDRSKFINDETKAIDREELDKLFAAPDDQEDGDFVVDFENAVKKRSEKDDRKKNKKKKEKKVVEKVDEDEELSDEEFSDDEDDVMASDSDVSIDSFIQQSDDEEDEEEQQPAPEPKKKNAKKAAPKQQQEAKAATKKRKVEENGGESKSGKKVAKVAAKTSDVLSDDDDAGSDIVGDFDMNQF